MHCSHHYSTNSTLMTTSSAVGAAPSYQPPQPAIISGQQLSNYNHHHHHHHHHKNASPNARYSVANNAGHGQIQVNAVMHQSYASGQEATMVGDTGMVAGGIDHMPVYSNLSQSRDALNESHNQMAVTNPLTNEPQIFVTESTGQVLKQPLAKTNSDSGAMEASSTSSPSTTAQDMSRIYSSRDGKYNARGQRLHRTIPRHFTTSIPGGCGAEGGNPTPVAQASSTTSSVSSVGALKRDPRDSHQQTLRRNKSEKALSGQNKKPVCQCPIQHVPMAYMGSTTFSSNQLLASNVTGPTKLVSNHHHKSMLNVAKLTQQQQQMVLEPAKGYDDELKLMTNSLRRIKTKVPDASSNSSAGAGKSNVAEANVKIPTISKQVLNSDKEKTASAHEHQIQSILKQTPVPSKRTSIVPGSSSSNTTTTAAAEANLNNPPPFPIEMIDSLSVSQRPPQQISSNGCSGATCAAVACSSADQNPALPPKMYKSNRHHGNGGGSIHTISKSPRMSFPQSSSSGISGRPSARTMDLFPNSERNQASSSSSSVTKLSATSFPSSVNHITYSLPKANHPQPSSSTFTPFSNSGGSLGIQSLKLAGGGRGVSTLSEVLSKVPSVVNVPAPPMGYQSKAPKRETVAPLPGCSKSVGESHFNHQQNYHNHHQQPKNSAKQQAAAHYHLQHVNAGATAPTTPGEPDKPLPVCTTSKNCSNPKEHFMPNEGSLDDDYLSECENCKSVFGSRYYLEEQVSESPQETMTLQRKPETTECEEQTYYRASTTLPTNTKQKNT